MAASGYTPISLYYSTSAGVAPTNTNLVNGELAINITDGKLYYKDNGGTVQLLASKSAATGPAGSNTQLQFNNSGVFGASSNLTWNGTTLGTTGFTASSDSSFTSTGALTISKGATGDRPGSPVSGMFRFNTSTSEFEGYNGSSWSSVGGAAISNDTSTSSTRYPLFASTTSGSATTVYTSNANYLYTPSTGKLKSKFINASSGILVNSQTVDTSYTIASGSNGFSVGPVTVSSGVAVTVASGQRWIVI